MSDSKGPTPPSERIVSLDALRGFALLGILVINIRLFSMPEVVLFNPTAYGDFTGTNYLAWLVGHVFVEQKFITLFTYLFGAGVILFADSAERKGESALPLHVRRNLWLVVFGLAHAYLLWYGDILVRYGLCALLVFFYRNHAAGALARLGIILLAIPSAFEVLTALSAGPAVIESAWNPAQEVLRAEIETYRSGWLAQMDHRVPTSFDRQTTGFLTYSFWRVSGAMLLGMALFKWGIMTNERSTGFYRRLILAGGASGLALTLAGVWFIEASNWDVGAALYWQQFYYWGSFLLAAAYVGVIMLFTRRWGGGRVTGALAAVGRTAFSNYLLQTVIATSIFYGHGLGLFGQVNRAEALGIVAVIWLVEIVLSVLWLRYFRFGPMEWLWRVLTYRQRYPIRKDRG